MLARRFGVPVPEGRVEPGPDRKEREELLALMEAAAQHFTRTLWTAQGTKAREYLLGRGFQKETLEKIRAGRRARRLGRPARARCAASSAPALC
jgi:DNA primase